jgi:arylsulfatase A-like enzyme
MNKEKPNILIFITDQQRADHLGCMGHPVLKTPNIDKLGEAGTIFTSCYTSCPACSPARATLFSGLSNRAHGLRMNGTFLPEDVPTLPSLLAEAGYRTHAVGKTHLKPYCIPRGADIAGYSPQSYPECLQHWADGSITASPGDYYGLQTIDSVIGHGSYSTGNYKVWLDENYPGEHDKYNNPSPSDTNSGTYYPGWELDLEPELHYNKWIADRTIDFLEKEQDSDSPFFLWCSFPDPHSPFAALRKWAEMYGDSEFPLPVDGEDLDMDTIPQTVIDLAGGAEEFRKKAIFNSGKSLRKLYEQTFGMIGHVDEQIGRIMATLEACSFTDNTIIVFTSDHGDQLGEHGLMHKNFWPYDGCNKVPFIIKTPSSFKHARKVDRVVSFYDFVPTILDYAGVEQPDPDSTKEFLDACSPISSPLPGESLKDVIESGRNPKRGNALVEFDDDIVNAFDLAQMRMIVTDDYKLCFYSPTKEIILFDRKNDPHEINNHGNNPAYNMVIKELFAELLQEIARTDSRFPRRVAGS